MPPIRTKSILVLGLLVLVSQAKGVLRVTVDAGDRNLDGLVALYAGPYYMVLDRGEEMEAGNIADIGYPELFQFTATSESLDYQHSYKYGADFYYDYHWGTNTKRIYNEDAYDFFKTEGPDAVATVSDKALFFKGCEVVEEDDWTEPINVERFDLPCNPDAAWKTYDEKKITVLKGDQIWTWDGKNRATGPVPFSSEYKMTSWELIPSNE